MTHALYGAAVLDDLAAFLLAATCAGCDEVGAFLCGGCRAALAPDTFIVRSPGGVRVRAALRFESVPARCIRRVKGHGQTALAYPLGRALAAALAESVQEATPQPGAERIGIVPIPTGRASYRRRGYRVPEMLIRRAGAVPWRVLRTNGARHDQRGLGVAQRVENVRGSMRTTRTGQGARIVLVDDVITTGATIDEAARTLESAGFRVVSAVVVAATPRYAAPLRIL